MRSGVIATKLLGLCALAVFQALLAQAPAQAQHPEHARWELEFQGTATVPEGGRAFCIVRIGLEPGNPFRTIINGVFAVTNGMTATQKAKAAYQAVQANDAAGDLALEYEEGDNEFFATPTDQTRFIADATITCTGMGETGDAWKDDPTELRTPVRGAYLNLRGRGFDGVVRFGLGGPDSGMPIVEVDTDGKTGVEILREIVAEFNRLYAPHRYTARIIPGLPGLHVAGVPCPLGVFGGSTDPDLTIDVGLLRKPKTIRDFRTSTPLRCNC